MATLKSVATSSRELVSEYEGKTAVYLEGDTDVTLFQNYWFMERLNKLRFVQPEGIGSSGVLHEVAQYRITTGLPAFGIIDRDKLVADEKWELVWETDDLAFSAAKPYGEHIRVTRRWEIESYLVHTEAVEEHISACNKGRACRPHKTVDAEFLQHAEALIPHAAMNSARRFYGERELGDGATSKLADRNAVEYWLDADHQAAKINEDIWNTYNEYLPKVEAFGSGTTPPEKLKALLRRVNGKALIHRIKSQHSLKDDPTFTFAKAIARLGFIPDELSGYLDEFCLA